jgi:hypothetical protein
MAFSVSQQGPCQLQSPEGWLASDVSHTHTTAMLTVVPRPAHRALRPAVCSLQGQAAPAYVITPTVTPLGSEYLITGLGCGVLGVHSLATGRNNNSSGLLVFSVPK